MGAARLMRNTLGLTLTPNRLPAFALPKRQHIQNWYLWLILSCQHSCMLELQLCLPKGSQIMSQRLPDYDLIVTENPLPADVDAIFAVIRACNDAHIDVWRPQRLGIFVRDEQNRFVGGIYLVLARGWMYLDGLAVVERARQQKLGSQLLNAAEKEARQRDCHHAWLETYSFQARPFYEQHGYQVFGILYDHPIGHQRYFMQKSLSLEIPH
jgi:GNAT superfamily N-acetyltransferase